MSVYVIKTREQLAKEYAARNERMFEGMCEEMGKGYTRLYHAYRDLSAAELDGAEAAKTKATQLYKKHENSYKYIAELVLSLNWKRWNWYATMETAKEKGKAELEAFSREMSKTYSALYYAAMDAFYEAYEGEQEACDYFFRVTD